MTDLTSDITIYGAVLREPANENRPISAGEAIAALTFVERGVNPRRVLEAALAMQEELTPQLLEELALAPMDVLARHEEVADEGTAYYLHEIAMHLLAAWREPRGWQLVLDYYVSDCDLASALSDVGMEAYLPGILVRCYDGSDLRSFERIIETPALDPLFRQACLQAYHGLVLVGRAPRWRFVDFLLHLLNAPADAEPGEWFEWLALRAAQVQERALLPAIGALVERGLTGQHGGQYTGLSGQQSMVGSLEAIEAIYAGNPASIAGSILAGAHFRDVAASISAWNWFAHAGRSDQPVTLPWRIETAPREV